MLCNILEPNNNYDIYVSNLEANTSQINNLSVNLINGLPPPSATPITAPVNSILTVTSPGVASFTDDVDINDININGNLLLNNNSGITNQFIKKNSISSQSWDNIGPTDMSPGLPGQSLITNNSSIGTWSYLSPNNFATGVANTVLTSNSSGSVNWTKLPVGDIFPGANDQVLMTLGGSPIWNLISPSNISPNVPNTALITNALGLPQFSKIPPIVISHGTSNQVLQTSQSGNLAQWTSTLGIDSILFTGNVFNFQSVFDRYYTASIQLPLYAVTQGGSPSIYQNINVNGYVSVIGKRIELTVYPFKLSSLFGGAVAPCYLSFLVAPSYLRAANLLGISGDQDRQSTVMCSISQNTTTQQEPAFANIYNNYYNSGACYLELTKGNAGNFIPNSYHGEPFVSAGIEFMELKAPFTISYIGE